jgi:hypothetical protein
MYSCRHASCSRKKVLKKGGAEPRPYMIFMFGV